VTKPLLIDGLKFDLRLYILLQSVDPLRIFLYKEGMARFSTVAYQVPSATNLKNQFMHLTNYAINQKNKDVFQFNDDAEVSDVGHKRTFTSILNHIVETYPDGQHKVNQLLLQIELIIIRTILTVQPSLKSNL